MKFTLKDKATDKILCTGTKQECMHFLKVRRYNRNEVYFETDNKIETFHTTVPVVKETPPPKPNFLKRIFTRE